MESFVKARVNRLRITHPFLQESQLICRAKKDYFKSNEYKRSIAKNSNTAMKLRNETVPAKKLASRGKLNEVINNQEFGSKKKNEDRCQLNDNLFDYVAKSNPPKTELRKPIDVYDFPSNEEDEDFIAPSFAHEKTSRVMVKQSIGSRNLGTKLSKSKTRKCLKSDNQENEGTNIKVVRFKENNGTLRTKNKVTFKDTTREENKKRRINEEVKKSITLEAIRKESQENIKDVITETQLTDIQEPIDSDSLDSVVSCGLMTRLSVNEKTAFNSSDDVTQIPALQQMETESHSGKNLDTFADTNLDRLEKNVEKCVENKKKCAEDVGNDFKNAVSRQVDDDKMTKSNMMCNFNVVCDAKEECTTNSLMPLDKTTPDANSLANAVENFINNWKSSNSDKNFQESKFFWRLEITNFIPENNQEKRICPERIATQCEKKIQGQEQFHQVQSAVIEKSSYSVTQSLTPEEKIEDKGKFPDIIEEEDEYLSEESYMGKSDSQSTELVILDESEIEDFQSNELENSNARPRANKIDLNHPFRDIEIQINSLKQKSKLLTKTMTDTWSGAKLILARISRELNNQMLEEEENELSNQDYTWKRKLNILTNSRHFYSDGNQEEEMEDDDEVKKRSSDEIDNEDLQQTETDGETQDEEREEKKENSGLFLCEMFSPPLTTEDYRII